MSRPRRVLRPHDAPNDGSRRLRELLRTLPYGAVARKLGADPSGSGVRRWAIGDWKPDRIMRDRMEAHAEIGIPFDAWDEPNALEPPTQRREPPSTLPRPISKISKPS